MEIPLQENKPIENPNFYINEQGLLVFTAKYLLERGYCCGNGCLHCPYGDKKVTGDERKVTGEK